MDRYYRNLKPQPRYLPIPAMPPKAAGQVKCEAWGVRVLTSGNGTQIASGGIDLGMAGWDMCNRKAEDEIGQDAETAAPASDGLGNLASTMGHTESLPRAKHTGRAPAAVAPGVPSEQLQAGLSKQSKLPRWSKPTFRIWPDQAKAAVENDANPYSPSTVNRILDWLAGLLERTEDTVDYLRANLERMPARDDPVDKTRSDAAEQLRRALDEQLEAHVSQSVLIKATIARRERFCAAIGGMFALPGTIPGIGTAAQLGLGMAATWPESDLIRYQMWCLQVELLHLYGMTYAEADADLLREGSLNYEWINKGGEAFAQRLLAGLHQSTAAATGLLDRFLVRVGASTALRESAGRILAKTLPLGIGVAIGATVNYLKLHMFARRQLRRMQVTVD